MPSFRQFTRGGGAPSALQGSRAVWFTEAFTAGGPGWMVGTAGGEAQRGRVLGPCRSQGGGAGRVGWGHSLWTSTWKATLVLPAALRAVQL